MYISSAYLQEQATPLGKGEWVRAGVVWGVDKHEEGGWCLGGRGCGMCLGSPDDLWTSSGLCEDI